VGPRRRFAGRRRRHLLSLNPKTRLTLFWRRSALYCARLWRSTRSPAAKGRGMDIDFLAIWRNQTACACVQQYCFRCRRNVKQYHPSLSQTIYKRIKVLADKSTGRFPEKTTRTCAFIIIHLSGWWLYVCRLVETTLSYDMAWKLLITVHNFIVLAHCGEYIYNNVIMCDIPLIPAWIRVIMWYFA